MSISEGHSQRKRAIHEGEKKSKDKSQKTEARGQKEENVMSKDKKRLCISDLMP